MKGTIHYVQWQRDIEPSYIPLYFEDTEEVDCDNAKDSDGNDLGHENRIKYPERGTFCREYVGGTYHTRAPYVKAEDERTLCTSCALAMNLELTFSHIERDDNGNAIDLSIDLDTLEKIVAEDKEFWGVSG